jgi:hypothetical protein
MKVVGAEGGRVVIIYSAEEIRPDEGLVATDLVKKIAERYKFATIPNVGDLKGDFSVINFKTGSLMSGQQKFAIYDFTILQGAMSVDCLTTDHGEAFLKDALQWGAKEFGLKPFRTAPKYYFLSSVVVEFEGGADTKIASFSAIGTALTRALRKYYSLDVPVEFNRIVFNCDPQKLPQAMLRTDFAIERRANWPYDQNRFFCQGPFRTTDLLDLISQFEVLVLKG